MASHAHVLEVINGLRNLSHATDTQMTEVISPNDRRAKSAKIKKDIKDEWQGLMKRGCSKVVKKFKLPHNANVLPCKYALVIKYYEHDGQRYRAHFVLGVNHVRRKAFITHKSQTVQPSSTCILLSCSDMNDFKLWSEDAPQVYTQSEEPLAPLVTIDEVQPEFGLKDDECLQVIKPI